MTLRQAFLLAGCTILPLFARADNARTDSTRTVTERTHLLSVGTNDLLDSYLSPLLYRGLTVGYTRIGERGDSGRRASWITVFDLNVTRARNPARNGTAWDAEARFDAGRTVRLSAPDAPLRWSVGGTLGALIGGTYNLRNGNNPAQAHMALEASAVGIARYRFRLLGRRADWRTQLDIPLAGLMFSPAYGQSYYEIFSLGHTDRNVVFTTPFQAPSLRLVTTLSLPLGRTALTVGYKADIRQSRVHHIDRHAWNHTLLIGFSRRLQFLPR